MLEIDTVEALDDLLVELRTIGVDHQLVEAKATRTEMPATLWQSVVGFANTDSGGLVILGVDENGGAFDVVGIENPARVHDTFSAMCSELDPPLRPAVYPIAHPDGVVIAARIPPVPRNQRPCHKPGDPYRTSYIRVADRDDLMTQQEVDDLRANRTGTDHSSRPAPAGAKLDPALATALVPRLRGITPRNADLTDDQLMLKYGATHDDGTPTLAGFLALGDNPEARTAAARLSFQVAPTPTDPEGTRFHVAKHLEGTVGQILDDALAELTTALGSSVVTAPSGHLVDQPETPLEALREVLSNALMHRSLAPGQDSSSALLAVRNDHVLVMSPGSVHVDVDPRDLGYSTTLGTPRNLSLARLCEHMTTPSGGRITEGQASGIRAADRACHAAGNAPPVFASKPARFCALLFRGPLDTSSVRQRWAAHGVALTDAQARIVAFADRLQSFLEDDPSSDFNQVRLDAKLVARLFERTEPERAAVELAALETLGVLVSRRLADRVIWEPRQPPQPSTQPQTPATNTSPEPSGRGRGRPRANRRAQVETILAAIAAHPDGAIRLSDAETALAVSRATANKVIQEAVEKNLIEPTTDVPHSPQRGYRLTRAGCGAAKKTTT